VQKPTEAALINQFQLVSSGKDLETLGSVTFQQVGTFTGSSRRIPACVISGKDLETRAASPSSRWVDLV